MDCTCASILPAALLLFDANAITLLLFCSWQLISTRLGEFVLLLGKDCWAENFISCLLAHSDSDIDKQHKQQQQEQQWKLFTCD
ncbi:uncharacterized protein LOC117573809 [Drosophila albomicans]|uniref:Uncharacterized protein LOC117573809 n=1 Tax=Drosophila albomicans TaxID=7291 RepID=A0A6P8XAA9_DROAB|nr:uncharacterized protein LOC117573809 [Drosophila albomicans]